MKTVAIYLSPRTEASGLFHYARTLAHALVRCGGQDYRLIAFSPFGTEWGPVCASLGIPWEEVSAPGIPERVLGKVIRVFGVRGARARRMMSRLAPLGRAMTARGVRLGVYTQYEHYSYELATPSLVPVHDLMHRYESRFLESQTFAGADVLFARICQGAAGILVDSEVGEQQLIESYGPVAARVFVLPFIPPDYVYDSSLLADDPSLPALVESLPERFLFYPAQFREHKNHVRLIEAVHDAAVRCPDIRLVLAGAPKDSFDAVKRRIDELQMSDRVRLLGYVSDAAKLELYRRAVALVMPTFYGPTNIPPLEAFEMGCPVATSRIYGIPDQLGDAALYFDPESVDEIRDVIERLWSDEGLRDELVERGCAHARAWGPVQFSESLRSIVLSLLGEGESA